MPRPRSVSEHALTGSLERVFRSAGYEGASLAMLARAAGLAKAALYHRFPGGKEEIALAVLGETGRRMRSLVLAPLAAPGDPAARLAAMVAGLRDFYDDGARPCLVDLFSVGGAPRVLRDPLAAGLAEWIGAIARLLGEAGLDGDTARARAEDAVVRIQGALVVARACGDAAPFGRVLDRLASDLLAGCGGVGADRPAAAADSRNSGSTQGESDMSHPKTFLEIVGAPGHPSPLDRSALVLIDIQREYVDGAVPLENVHGAAAEAGRLLALARGNGVPVFHVAHGYGPGAPVFAADGPYVDLLEPVRPLEGEPVVWKTHANAFIGTGLAERIRATGRDEVIIAGDMTHVCVSTSARAAAEEHGFRVTVVGDATAARDLPLPGGGVVPAETVRRTALAELADAFAVVVKDASAWG